MADIAEEVVVANCPEKTRIISIMDDKQLSSFKKASKNLQQWDVNI